MGASLRISIALMACHQAVVPLAHRRRQRLQVVDMELQRHCPTTLGFAHGCASMALLSHQDQSLKSFQKFVALLWVGNPLDQVFQVDNRDRGFGGRASPGVCSGGQACKRAQSPQEQTRQSRSK